MDVVSMYVSKVWVGGLKSRSRRGPWTFLTSELARGAWQRLVEASHIVLSTVRPVCATGLLFLRGTGFVDSIRLLLWRA